MLTALLVMTLSAGADAGTARPLYYERAVTQADVDGRSLRELSIMRNWIWARAGNTFRKKWLADYFGAQPWYAAKPKVDQSKLTATDKKNSEFIAEYEAKIPQAKLKDERAALLGKKDRSPDDDVELRLVSERLGIAEGLATQARTPLEDPAMLDKVLKVDDLGDLSQRDLRILRNMVYARRGRPFKSPVLRAHFESLEWYHADPKYTDARLTDVDKKNVQIIRSVEDSIGGPIDDAAQKAEESGQQQWYGAA